MKTLLLDIDYTMAHEQEPRPFLKEFLLTLKEQYNLVIYTGGTSSRVTDFLRILYHKLEIKDREFIHDLQITALHRGNCDLIEYPTSSCSSIYIKCLKKASEILNIPVEDLTLIDDTVHCEDPYIKQIIQAEGFYGQENDDYLQRLLKQLI